MNWITKNNYTIKRKFNHFNFEENKKKKNNNNNKKGNEQEKGQNMIDNKKQINYNINNFNQDDKNNLNNNNSCYYQINADDNLERLLKNGENIIQDNLNCKYILSELSEF